MKRREERVINAMAMGLTKEDLVKWDNIVEETDRETKEENRILDPFKGFITRK